MMDRDEWAKKAAKAIDEHMYDDEREELADFLDELHGPWVTEGGCDFRAWYQPWHGSPRVSESVDALLGWLRDHGFHRTVQGEPITAGQYARIIAKVYEPDLDWDNPAEYDLIDRETLMGQARKVLDRLKQDGFTVQKGAE